MPGLYHSHADNVTVDRLSKLASSNFDGFTTHGGPALAGVFMPQHREHLEQDVD
jgi:hypothetical protein